VATDLTDWSSEILPDIPNAPSPAIVMAARDACIRFCEQTHLWTLTLDPIDVDEDEPDYTLTIPTTDYGKLIGVPKDGVFYKEDEADDDQYRQLTCMSEELTNRDEKHAWKYEEAPSPAKFWVDNIDKKLHLRPIPTEDSEDGLLVTVIVKPIITATTVADFLYDDYRREIGSGALSYLYRMRKMPWYDKEHYSLHEAAFLNACGDAKINKLTGGTNMPLSLKMPFFA